MLFRISMITHIYISICSPVFIIPTPCFYTTIFIKYIYTRIFFSSCSWICRCRCMIFFRCYIYLIALISRYRLFFPLIIVIIRIRCNIRWLINRFIIFIIICLAILFSFNKWNDRWNKTFCIYFPLYHAYFSVKIGWL